MDKVEFNSLININSVKPDEVVDRWEEEQHEKLMTDCIAQSGIPEDYRKCSFDNFRTDTDSQKNLKKEVTGVWERIVGGEYLTVILSGDFGNGKTHLGCAMLTEYLRRNEKEVYGIKTPRKIKYTTFPDLCKEYSEALSFTARERQSEILKRYRDYDLLFVDEVGKGKKDTERELLYLLQDSRDHVRHPTIYATNMSGFDFIDLGGGAFSDRIKCSACVIETKSKSFRFFGILGGRR